MLKYQLIIFLASKLFVVAEWIEMPQFSDDSKVYKSVQSLDSFYKKFHSEIYDVGGFAEFGNVSGGSKDASQSLETATIYPADIFNESLDDDDETDVLTADDDPELITSYAETSTTDLPLRSTLDFPTDGYSATTLSSIPDESKIENCKNETIEGLKFQDYLPMDMLTKVHQTLKSQPSTLEGKIVFLKKFENDLMAEIGEWVYSLL